MILNHITLFWHKKHKLEVCNTFTPLLFILLHNKTIHLTHVPGAAINCSLSDLESYQILQHTLCKIKTNFHQNLPPTLSAVAATGDTSCWQL